MDDYKRMVRDEDGRDDQEIWNLVGSHPLFAHLREIFYALLALATSLDADNAFYTFISTVENAAYDKLSAKHGPPSEELSQEWFMTLPVSDAGWMSTAFKYHPHLDHTDELVVR